MHAELKIGDSIFFLADEMPMSSVKSPAATGSTTVMINLFVPDCDALFKQATAAGAAALTPPADMFWGDRYSQVRDPFGHVWSLATRKEDLSPEEIQARAGAFFAEMAKADASKKTDGTP